MDLLHIGKLCTQELCKQKDFLPYKCQWCEETFCQEHFRPDIHSCKSSQNNANKAIVCPFCMVTIKYKGSHNETEALDIHQATECNPANRDKILKEKEVVLCQAGTKCKNKLTALNTYTCKSCDRALCLKCRLPEDHTCKRQVQDKNSKKLVSVENQLQQIRLNNAQAANPNILGGTINNRREYNQNSYQQQADSIREQEQRSTAQQMEERRQRLQQQQSAQQQQEQRNLQQAQQLIQQQQQQQQLLQQQQQQQQQQQLQQRQQQLQQQNNRPQPDREICQICNQQFDDVMALISHADSTHSNQPSTSNNNSASNMGTRVTQAREICDQCGKSFANFEELFQHAEVMHYNK